MTRLPLPPEPLTPDAELLRRYAADRDQTAFELLVWRYGRLVSEVCRRVLRHRHDTEDAAQATFLVFARRADTVRTAVGGWLAKVAYRCARDLATRRRESPGSGRTGDVSRLGEPPPEPTDPDFSAALDAELNRLPDRYRLPLVLCCLQGLSYQQAAAALHCKPGTLSGRLSRAKALLRDRLTARGVGLSVAAFTAALDSLTTHATAADPLRGLFAPSERVAAVADGVHRMMTLSALARPLSAVVLALLLLAGVGTAFARLPADEPKPVAKPADPPKEKKTDKELVQGDWVFDSAEASGGGNGIGQAWQSVVTFDADKLTITKYIGMDWKATFTLDLAESPRRFDMAVSGLPKWKLGFTDGTLKGIYRLDGDTLEMCLADTPDAPRPTKFETGPKLKQFRFTLKRKAKDFDPAKLTEFTVKVVDGDGEPVEGAVVCHSMMHGQTNQEGERLGWTYYPGYPKSLRTDKTGAVKLAAGESGRKLGGLLYCRHEKRKLVALEPLSPARIMAGVSVTLRPEAKLSGKVTLPGGIDPGETAVYLCTPTTIYAGGCFDPNGAFEFFVPPGEYRLLARGDSVSEEMTPGENHYPALSNAVPVTVGVEGKELKLEVKPSKIGALRGKDAPDLGEMAAWRGKEVKLADLKGKVVLLRFVNTLPLGGLDRDMPQLSRLHTNYADKGLVVIGVHVPDAYNEQVTTVKQLDKRLAALRTDKWPDGDIPFPIALMAKNDGPARKAYGSPQECVLIDKKGKVVGLHRPTREADIERLEKLLDEK